LKATQQGLADEREARRQEIARLDADAARREAKQRDAVAAQARRVSVGEAQFEIREHRVFDVSFPSVHERRADLPGDRPDAGLAVRSTR